MLAKMWSNKNSHSLLVGMKNDRAIFEDSLEIFTKLKTLLPYNPAIILFNIYPNELKTYVHTKTCT